jgi:hypothetical protein
MTLAEGAGLDTPGPPRVAQTTWEFALRTAVSVGLVVVFLVGLLVLPWLLPCLTLRARQPKGARVEWDDDEIIEWDGPWKRVVIPWGRARVTHLAWVVHGRLSSWTEHALQIVDLSSDASITFWRTAPKGAPLVRRRICGTEADMDRLLAAIAARGLDSPGTPEWSRMMDPDRPRRTWILVLGRLGYVFGAAAPLGAPDVIWPGYVLGAVAAGLLAIRALPVLHELRATILHLSAVRVAPAGATPLSTGDLGRGDALRLKLRAVGFEASARAAFVALVVVSTIVGATVFHR